MKNITFIDTEVSKETKRIQAFGAVKATGDILHEKDIKRFVMFMTGTQFICGHNIINHDIKYIKEALGSNHDVVNIDIIDTLYLSALLFPKRPYHALVKDDKLQSDEFNNPLNDAIKAKDLFYDEVEAFKVLPNELKRIYYTLLKNQPEFSSFFKFLDYKPIVFNIKTEIKELFSDKLCSNVNLKLIINDNPIELAYCLSLINADDEYSIIPRWILMQYTKVDILMHKLRNTPCLWGCNYCNERMNIFTGLKMFFGHDKYRDFDGVPLQERAVKAAIDNKSLLAVFPTGGGKSITFQVPALMAGRNSKGLTVVISPLQSLMKDQVDNLEYNNITDAVTINGLLDPIERTEAMRRVENGEAYILYISPESLRSKTIERLLLGRKIVRFVIDEAHCFSAWGQDFRVDYLYIAEFIKSISQQKNLEEIIPVSCFTATAKQNVIEDIRTYFKDNLNLNMELFTANAARKNLSYTVMEKGEDDKYDAIRNLLSYKECPTIIYVSRTKKAEELAKKLNNDGYLAKAYHGKMEKKEKSDNQDQFIKGEVNIMVATSAFGMGVDKKDVGMVIHYNISDTLENYVQEAGRAGRDQNISADCYVLFSDEDLNKHFILLNQTRINMQEIQQVWQAIKRTTGARKRMSNSALEIARQAGWEESVDEIETRVKTAIAALEDAGYIKRGQNMPRVYADSIKARNTTEAIDKIQKSKIFNKDDEEKAIRIIKKMISSRNRKKAQDEVAESRVDYISDDLGLGKREVIRIITMLREAEILVDAKDLTAYMDKKDSLLNAMNTLYPYMELEKFLLKKFSTLPEAFHIKELNEQAEEEGIKKSRPDKIKIIINFWVIKGLLKREVGKYSQDHIKVFLLNDKEKTGEELQKRFEVAEFILQYLDNINEDNESIIEFSVLELKEAYDLEMQLLQKTTTINDIENALFYLSRIGVLKLEGGFLVSYNAISIERIQMDNKIRYKVDDYKKLKSYYENKTQMIHIVGEYAKKMMEDYRSALQFVEDYFELEYSSFLRKYFRGTKGTDIQRNISPEKFKKLFGELSPTQLKIINDKESKCIVVAAGPGSGKTRILVHKLASLLLMEDVKHEQMLMITFSRAAATEFKKRLFNLIGNAAHYVDIKTFHSYCFDLLGKVGNIEKSDNIIEEATSYIESGEADNSKATKTVLVIDEAQDMDEHEYRLVNALIKKNEDMRIIAVGDDDQNIYTFRGSDSKYMQSLLHIEGSMFYELTENYRSKANIVCFTNVFVNMLKERLKKTSIMSMQRDNGKIEVITYKSNQLIIPLVNNIINEGIHGSTCILTKTNDEALQVTGLLHKNEIRAKLIQSNERYDLYNLVEIRYFISELHLSNEGYVINNEAWQNARMKLKDKFIRSKNLFICERLIKDFEEINKEIKYKSDLMLFIKESSEDDFYNDYQTGISVSTIHKSKGREFDYIIMILSDFNINSEELKRQLYVGMTRAKKGLTIHYNGSYFDIQKNNQYVIVEELHYKSDNLIYESSGIIVMQLKYNDVYLSYFEQTQNTIKNLISGDELKVDRDGCLDKYNNRVLRFSNKFKMDILNQESKGYNVINARVNHILYWWNEEKEREILVVFPEVELMRKK